ncbi:hypothetical protein YPPY56_4576, partial [Yersinia pestis PY-56]
MVHPRHQ